jgi:hypothetical protein
VPSVEQLQRRRDRRRIRWRRRRAGRGGEESKERYANGMVNACERAVVLKHRWCMVKVEVRVRTKFEPLL